MEDSKNEQQEKSDHRYRPFPDKYGLNQQLEGMTDEEYLAHPIGLDVGEYVADLMKYCPEHIVDQVMEHQDALLRRLGTDYLTVIAYMPYEEDGGTKYA